MTRKDFRMLADVVNTTFPKNDDQKKELVHKLEIELYKTNEHFDAHAFRMACGLEA